MTIESPLASESPLDLDPVVAGALNEYLNVLDSGIESERQAWLLRHAELMPQLQVYLDGLNLILELSPSLRTAAREMQEDPNTEVLPRTFGDFRILRRISRGGMGIVYEAEQISLKRRVAVKILPFAGTLDDTITQRFKREAQAAASLNHPHIVPVITVGCERGVHFYAMQLIDGHSMAERIQACRPPFSESEDASALPRIVLQPEWFRMVAKVGIQAARAIHYAHEQGIIHRDIKPGNLLLDEKNQLFVTDFGLASTQELAGLTVSGHMTGTLRYASPEQVLGKRAGVDHRTDIYSLGASLYELATLSSLVSSEDQRAMTHEILSDSHKTPRQLNPSVPRDLEKVILQAIAADRIDRYETSQEFADDLQRFLDGQPVKARQQSRAVMLVRSLLRRPRLAIGAFLLLICLIGILTASTFLVNRARQSAELLQRLAESQAKQVKSLQETTQQQLEAAVKHNQVMEATRYTKSVSLSQQMFNEHNVELPKQILTASIPQPGELDLRGFEWHYLHGLCNSGGQEDPGHQGDVYNLTWSPDGRRLATASQDKTVRIWTLLPEQHSNGQSQSPLSSTESPIATLPETAPVIVLTGHTADVNCVAFSSDGLRVASASDDGTIRIWNLSDAAATSGQRLPTPQSPSSGRADSSPDSATSSWFRELKGHDNPVVGVAFSPQTGHLISSDDRGQMFVWDSETGEILSRTQVHSKRVEGFEITRDGSRIVTAGNDSTVGIWDASRLPQLSELRRLTGPEGAVYGAAWSRDGTKAVAAGWDTKLRIWAQEHADSFPVLMSGYGEVKSVCFSPDGRWVTYTSQAGNICQVEASSGQIVDLLHIPGGRCWTAQYSPNGDWLAAAGSGKSLFVWPADPEVRHAGEKIPTNHEITEILVTNDGKQLVTFERPAHVKLRSVESGEISFEFPGEYRDSLSLGLGIQGELFALNIASEIECWDLTQSPPIRKDFALSGTQSVLITTESNRRFLGVDESVPIDLLSGKPILAPSSQVQVKGLPFVGPNPECIPVFRFNDGYWWYPAQQKQVACKYLQHPNISAFSQDGQILYTGGDNVIHQLRVGHSEPQGLPWPCQGGVLDLVVSPDGRTLVSTSGDALRFWNLVAQEAALTINHPGETVLTAAFAPDGQKLIYSTSNPAGSPTAGSLRFVRQ